MAGAAVVDATWHVGASAGQYASGRQESTEFDPFVQQFKNAPSYGVQSRLQIRAIVVQGPDGTRVALAKADLYIPQDLLWRRAAQILATRNVGIDEHNLTMTITHDHSSPYYSSTAWGAWTFQDVFDIRFYDYYAERIADAVTQAARHLVPVRVGATASYFDKPQRNALGPAVADDGTPAGFPNSYTDHDMTIVRFDDISNPRRPRPLAVLVNYSLHGEMLSGNDLISADWPGPTQRFVDRATGAITVIVQNAVGTTEVERNSYHSIHERLLFDHKEYGQAEYAARLISDAAIRDWRDIGAGRPNSDPAYRDRFIPFTADAPVGREDRWFPGPISHPYPGVSSCRTDPALQGNPRVPIVGLPDCEDVHDGPGEVGLPAPPDPGINPGLSTDDLESKGIPVPENYSAPSYTGLEEDLGVHLQAWRLGDMLFTFCSCEQWVEQSRNIKTRTDTVPGDEYLGFDWSAQCTRNADGTWTCPDPQKQCLPDGDGTRTCPDPANPDAKLPPISDHDLQRMRAQVNNPANGWDDPNCQELGCGLQAESEPTDVTKIRGNFTQDDTAEHARFGYRLTVPVSMANDYNGYIASYREYQRGDHYRKALTGWGPHSSDYMATRLVEMGRHLHGGPDAPAEPLDAKEAADQAHNDAEAQGLGALADTAIPAYEALLPDDGGKARELEQPKDVARFAAAFFTWNGGSNYTDNPDVRVERRVGARWLPFADQSGEVPVTLKLPGAGDAPSFLRGGQEWHWTATFEAFVSRFDLTDPAGRAFRATPAGTYRFVVSGRHRTGGRPVAYRLTSREFRVAPWDGITVDDLRRDPGGTVSFTVGPRHTYPIAQGLDGEVGPIDYPDTYASPVRFIRNQRTAVRDPDAPNDPNRVEWYCFTCSFRPWLDAGDARSARVLFRGPGGERRLVAARERNGRWATGATLPAGWTARVPADAVRDAWGDLNGKDSTAIGG